MTQDKMKIEMASQAKLEKENKINDEDAQPDNMQQRQRTADAAQTHHQASGRKPLFRN